MTNSSTRVGVVAPSQTLLAEPEIERVHPHRLVVGPDVQHDRKAHRGIDSRAGRIESQLPHRDSHPARSQIAEPEDALAVGDDDDPNVAARPVPQHVDHPTRSAALTYKPRGRRKMWANWRLASPTVGVVDDRHHLFDVVDDGAEEEPFVPVLERVEIDVALQVGGLRFVVLEDASELLVLGEPTRRDQPPDLQRVALGLGEAGPLVEQGVVENIDAAARHAPDAAVGLRVVHREHHRTSRARAGGFGAPLQGTPVASGASDVGSGLIDVELRRAIPE